MGENDFTVQEVQTTELTTQTKKKERQANFELLRIICMLLIVSWHFLLHGQWNGKMVGVNAVFGKILASLFMPSVNLFVMISAFFSCQSNTTSVNLQKVLKLWIPVFFYSIVLFIVPICTKTLSYDKMSLINSIFPFISGNYWFFSAYILLMLCAPFLNIIIRKITTKQHFCICLFFAIAGFVQSDLHYGFPQASFSNGYSIIWFIGLYFIASLIQRTDFSISKKPINIVIAVVLYVISLIWGYFGAHYTSLIITISSVIVFCMFKEIKINNPILSKTICKISTLTFGVYLIHDNPQTRSYMYNSIFHSYKYYENKIAFLILIGFIGVTFVACALIELVRQELFKYIWMLSKRIAVKIQNKN